LTKKRTILVTGGTGYIGSHVVVSLIERGYEVIILDNLSNSHIDTLDNIYKIVNYKPKFYHADLTDVESCDKVFKNHNIYAVMHFAALKSISESIKNPDLYEKNNINGSENLFELMASYGVKKIIFSSSACVYGKPEYCPIDEEHSIKAMNPYSNSKIVAENILRNRVSKDKDFSAVTLRYFNPIGGHESGLIGENPKQPPTNLMPALCFSAKNPESNLRIYGNDYPTKDGTGIRDYIHISDLVEAHIDSLIYLERTTAYQFFNLGSGKGFSVLDIIKTFQDVNSLKIKYKFEARRDGDVAISFTDISKVNKVLGWRTKKNLSEMCRDSLLYGYKNN
jgi:UDP-glucose 4-epimerase